MKIKGYSDLYVDQLYIEVTRRCTRQCLHCLKGARQNVMLDSEILYDFPESIKEIRVLVFTGGEPLLAPSQIKEILDIFIEKKILIRQIGIITNSEVYNKKVKETLDYIQKVSLLNLMISNDKYHNPNNKVMTKLISNHNAIIMHENHTFVKSGLAIENKVWTKENQSYKYKIINYNMVFITALGVLTNVIDSSYNDEDYSYLGEIKDLDQILIDNYFNKR